MIECNFIEKYIMDYIYDELDELSRRNIESHLNLCESCRKELSELQATITLIKTIEVKEPPRLLYFRNRRSSIAEFLNQKSIFTLAACILIALSGFMLVKSYQLNSYIASSAAVQTTPLSKSEIQTMLTEALDNYKTQQNIFVNSQFQQLEKKLNNYQQEQLVIFKNAVNKNTQDMINAALLTSDNQRMDDLRQVATTLQDLNSKHDYEQARTYQILNYLVNANSTRTKY